MDLIAQAVAKRDKLRADLARLDAFLAVAYELKNEDAPATRAMSDAAKVAAPIAPQRAASGVGAETALAAEEIVREAGHAFTTRDLVPLVEAKGIEIGGKDKVATLSARLGNDAKRGDGKLKLKAGKWHLPEWLSETANKEAADTPTKDASAASLFSNQEGGETNAAPLN